MGVFVIILYMTCLFNSVVRLHVHLFYILRFRTVLCSNYYFLSSHLHLLQGYLICCSYLYVRLDGSISIKKRAKIVDKFNDPAVRIIIFCHK